MEIDAARAINANKADADAQIEKYEELVKELKAEIKKLKKKNAQLTLRIASWTKAVRPVNADSANTNQEIRTPYNSFELRDWGNSQSLKSSYDIE